MFSNITYIADNNGQKELPQFDMKEMQPIPAFQVQQKNNVNQNSGLMQDTNFILIGLILIFIFFIILIGLFIKLMRSVSNKIPVDVEKDSLNKETVQINNEAEKLNVKNDEKEDNNQNILNTTEETKMKLSKLGTPNSIERCIKSFLQITQE